MTAGSPPPLTWRQLFELAHYLREHRGVAPSIYLDAMISGALKALEADLGGEATACLAGADLREPQATYDLFVEAACELGVHSIDHPRADLSRIRIAEWIEARGEDAGRGTRQVFDDNLWLARCYLANRAAWQPRLNALVARLNAVLDDYQAWLDQLAALAWDLGASNLPIEVVDVARLLVDCVIGVAWSRVQAADLECSLVLRRMLPSDPLELAGLPAPATDRA